MASLEERLEAIIGPRPEERTWCDEWVPLWLERARLEGKVYEWPVPPEYLLQAGGSDSVMTSQRDQASAIDQVVALGWKRPLAMAFTLLNNLFAAPLAAAVAERSPRFGAATHMICTALSQGAAKQQAVAPLCYKNLEGAGGLASADPAWHALLTGAGVGTTLVTNGCSTGWSTASSFPEEGGVFHNCVFRGGKGVFEPVDSDVVAFRSAPGDAGEARSLIQVGGEAFALPPLSTVKLERAQEAGEWRAHGKTVRRRLFIVSVAYRA
jgi:hypothetical protein